MDSDGGVRAAAEPEAIQRRPGGFGNPPVIYPGHRRTAALQRYLRRPAKAGRAALLRFRRRPQANRERAALLPGTHLGRRPRFPDREEHREVRARYSHPEEKTGGGKLIS